MRNVETNWKRFGSLYTSKYTNNGELDAVIEMNVDYEVTQADHTGACRFTARSTCYWDLILCEVLGKGVAGERLQT